MNRDTLVTVLLVIAGIVLAFILFGSGAFWKGRTTPKRSGQLSPADPYGSTAPLLTAPSPLS